MKYYIETYGCQMNAYDSGKLGEVLREHSFAHTPDPGEADIILVNTCSVRQHAEQRALARIGELAHVTRRTNAVLAVCGCMAQRLGPEILRKCGAAIVIGPDAYSTLIPAFDKARATGTKTLDTTRDSAFRFRASNGRDPGGSRALVSVMKGCSNECSFCIVPAVRGPAVSRPHEEVLEEVRVLVEKGVKDVTLIGQNVNAYSDREVGFAELLAMTSDTAHGSRVRFTTSHPRDMSDSVIQVMALNENVCEHIHLPLQSGSNRVLERMRRGYTTERYREIVKSFRDAVPGISITTDIIVGFPGETLDDFEKTCVFVRELRFDSAFMFKFSPRPGTEAASMADDVPGPEKQRRLAELISVERSVSSEKSAALVGSVMEVLVETEKKGATGFLLGKTRCNRTVHLKGPGDLVGRFVRARIDSSKVNSLSGVVVNVQSGWR